jgi:2-keto-4-pentenoate hydratase/2-oxohepta-3-ene-1,7-dioic acid hydratase in catechol pathway
VIFLKPPTAVIGPEEAIVIPRNAHVVEPEAELAAVIGLHAHKVEADSALQHVFGYTLVNDVTARDYMADGHWTRAKGVDTFCPVGPWIETEIDPDAVGLMGRVNGETVQVGSTSELVMDVASLIAYAADHFTLEPGDIILTGSPPGRVPLRPGDTVAVIGDGIGTLRNPVVAE